MRVLAGERLELLTDAIVDDHVGLAVATSDRLVFLERGGGVVTHHLALDGALDVRVRVLGETADVVVVSGSGSLVLRSIGDAQWGQMFASVVRSVAGTGASSTTALCPGCDAPVSGAPGALCRSCGVMADVPTIPDDLPTIVVRRSPGTR